MAKDTKNGNCESSDLREQIKGRLQALGGKAKKGGCNVSGSSFREHCLALLKTLGYESKRTEEIPNADPQAFLDWLHTNNPSPTVEFNQTKALFDEWAKADVLFQLTDDEIPHLAGTENLTGGGAFYTDITGSLSILESYIFFAIELENRDYARGKLTTIARQINRVFPMPVMVLIKHQNLLSIAVINRRVNKIHHDRDVLGKVTIIRDISLNEPHRGHLDILRTLVFDNLPGRANIHSFDTLHAAWEKVLNVEVLNDKFYDELFNWYYWALSHVEFPEDTIPSNITGQEREDYREKLRALGLIRLLTRLIFCWFLKEKGLIPERLFEQWFIKDILDSIESEASTYYHAILQNLFFATLNQKMGKDEVGNPYRRFAPDGGNRISNVSTYGIDTLYRYQKLFSITEDEVVGLFEGVPFLNGGLFECHDYWDDSNKKIYVDGFSREPDRRANIPNKFFFGEGKLNVGKVRGEKKSRTERAKGLLHILSKYKFTVVENTPIDQDIALDPELLGKVLESLLASYNEETRVSARKMTGAFYTPRPIVEYMVDESLKAYLTGVLAKSPVNMSKVDAATGLDILFAYTEKEHAFNEREVAALISGIRECKVLDPAVGSGAFPMGVLHKLIYVLNKLEPNNTNDYESKLHLIENCLYGSDIEPMAIQLSKLRFFISLLCDQLPNSTEENLGIIPLPNLETKFVVADSLGKLSLEQMHFNSELVLPIQDELQQVRHDYFTARTREEKKQLRDKDNELRDQLEAVFTDLGVDEGDSQRLATWNPYDPQMVADFFEPSWMFDRSVASGFDVVVGNPPYIQLQKNRGMLGRKYQPYKYKTFAKSGDIYCLFYERGVQLLSEDAHLCFITSNKWMRSGYGKKLRLFFSDQNPKLLLDLGPGIFESATVDTNILLLQNSHAKGDCDLNGVDFKLFQKTHDYIADYVCDQKVRIPKVDACAWYIGTHAEVALKAKLDQRGLPLKSWNILINRGVITGLNAAFIIDESQRDVILGNCATDSEKKKTAALLQSVINGKDIKRYEHKSPAWYLIAAHNGYGKTARVNINAFPSIKSHLDKHWHALKSRFDQGDTPYNLRDCSYYKEFDKHKIVWGNIAYSSSFHLSIEGEYVNAPANILTSSGPSLKYLLGVMNSSTFNYEFSQMVGITLGKAFEWKKSYVEQIHIPRITDDNSEQVAHIESLVGEILQGKQKEADTTAQEDEIDQLVYKLYGLNADEIAIIEGTSKK